MSDESNKVGGAERLQQVHGQAIAEVQSHLKHWENAKEDYDNLSKRLSTLPLKLTQDVMVPFGPLAFMPGQLIHTNELLVHLGDSWFAETTCSQGLKIIEHRLETVNKNIEDLNKTLTNLEKKSEFNLQELSNAEGDKGIEIKEEVSADYVHPSRKKRISRVKEKKPLSHEEKEIAVKSCMNDEELMSRLDELERLEEEEDAEEDSLSDVSNPDTRNSEMTDNKNSDVDSKSFDKSKRVSWNKDLNSYKLPTGRDADSSDSDDQVPNTVTIRFKHTPTEKKQSEKIEHELNPGNIVTQKPTKSILKTDKNKEIKTVKEKVLPTTAHKTNVMFGVSDVVKEHPSISHTEIESQSKPTKRISKFKASRLK